MLSKDVIYLIKHNRSTKVVNIHNETEIDELINVVINKACLKHLTTLDGRLEAIKKGYKIYKLIPIYISNNLILQPLYSNRNWNQIYVNICNIKKIIKVNDLVVITFINDISINIDISYERFKRYYKNCLKIKEDQINLMKEEIYNG
ncbi:MAG: competence protein ComK [Bacilli bacterium]|nr:competence protein ComK [Bacilli bacterium]